MNVNATVVSKEDVKDYILGTIMDKKVSEWRLRGFTEFNIFGLFFLLALLHLLECAEMIMNNQIMANNIYSQMEICFMTSTVVLPPEKRILIFVILDMILKGSPNIDPQVLFCIYIDYLVLYRNGLISIRWSIDNLSSFSPLSCLIDFCLSNFFLHAKNLSFFMC